MMSDFLRDMQEGITASLGVPAHVIDPSQAVPMPTTQESLLLHILQRPDDDAPRLIYADWLDENNEPERAEFIRLQIDRANKPLLWHNELHMTRERDLQGRFGHLWSAGLPQGLPRYFGRGFVNEIRIDHDYFLLHAERLFLLHPITRVVLHDKRPWDCTGGDWGWAWLDGYGNTDNRDRLSSEIFRIVHLLAPAVRQGIVVCGFDTEQNALDALCQGCVALGQERAGLPPLTK